MAKQTKKEIIYGKVLLPVLGTLFSFLPVKKKKAVFCNFQGRGFGGEPKYIAEEFLRRGGWDLVWLSVNSKEKLPEGIRQVNYGGIRSWYELATASVWVNNIRNTQKVRKRKKQVYLQTWHGGIGFKKVEGEIETQLDIEYIKDAKKDGKLCDAILAVTSFNAEQMKKDFWLNKTAEILLMGSPSNDRFFEPGYVERKCIKLREELGCKEDSIVILYAPTFREGYSLEGYQFDFEHLIKGLNQDVKVLVSRHPNMNSVRTEQSFPDGCVDVSGYSDFQELYCVADMIITDYSSVGFTFAGIFRKPVFICTLDYEQYKSQRELNDLFENMPFPHSYSLEELIDQINHFDEKQYTEKIDCFFSKVEMYDDGKASKKLVDWIEGKFS